MKRLFILLLIAFSISNSINAQTICEVHQEIKSQGIHYPDIVIRQVVVETGWLRCDNCSREKNNLFGFSINGEYLTFDTWQESVSYYKWWQDSLYDPNRDYYEFLNCLYKTRTGQCISYAAGSTYTNYLKKINIPCQ